MEASASPQTAGNSSQPQGRSLVAVRAYGPRVADSAMIKFLAAAAKQLREEADRRLYQVASSPTDRLDPSTIYRFEKGRWPENADRMVDLYADDLEIEPIEIWARALELWQEAQRSENGRGR
jgi:hypothetical protein